MLGYSLNFLGKKKKKNLCDLSQSHISHNPDSWQSYTWYINQDGGFCGSCWYHSVIQQFSYFFALGPLYALKIIDPKELLLVWVISIFTALEMNTEIFKIVTHLEIVINPFCVNIFFMKKNYFLK